MNGFVDDTAAICGELNDLAPSLAPELLPNGVKRGTKWMFSGIPDTGRSESAWVHLSGPKIGRWMDAGSCAAGEDKGDMLDLVRIKRCHGDAAAAFDEARRILGRPRSENGRRVELSPEEKARRAEAARRRAEERERAEAAEYEKKAKGARRLFLRAAPIAGTGGEAYLRGRELDPGAAGAWPGSLRFFDQVYHGQLESKLPALLGCIVTAEGRHIGTHRIFLSKHRTAGWAKLQGATAKMVLGNFWGGFVPIHKGASGQSMRAMPEGEPVYVCEGIEDAVAIRMIAPERRILAAVSLANIGAIVLPRQARELVVVADRDDKPEARDTLERAIAQQQARGLSVKLVLPPRLVNGHTIKDVNDWVRALRAGPAESAAA